MDSYDTTFSAGPTLTFGRIFAGIAATTASIAFSSPDVTPQDRQPLPIVTMLSQGSSSGSVAFASSIGYAGADADVYAAFTRFYGDLNAAQRPLEPEFAKVLFENLWDLYAE